MPGEWFEWEWDESLFAGAAPYYERGRLPYAPGLAEAMAAALGLDGRGRLLDVGCGPGTVTLRVAHLFEEAVGLDPDAGMLREAARLAVARGAGRVRWVRLRAEDLPADLGLFRVVTFAQSFHWMDRPLVAARVRGMLDPGGAVVHVDRGSAEPVGADPKEAIDELRRAYLGGDRRAGASIRNSSPDDEDDVFRGAGLVGPEIVAAPDGRVLVRPVDDLIAETLSNSSTAPHLFGERLPEFEADLRRVLTEAAADGSFRVRMSDTRLRIWRAS